MKLGVTTAINPKMDMIEMAHKIAKDLSLEVYERKKKGINKLLVEHELEYMFVVQSDRLTLQSKDNTLFWHPGTSVIKLWDTGEGKGSQLLEAIQVGEGDRVLDCTLGYGSDAIVMASGVGTGGRVVGLEANRYLAYMARLGLRTYTQVSDDVKACMSRVEVIHANYRDYLKCQPDNAFDVVYFDPMFQNTNEKSKSMSAIKDFALGDPLEMESIEEALRVCRKRVVVKERIGGGVFKKLGIRRRVGDIRFGAVVYGVIEKNSLKNQ